MLRNLFFISKHDSHISHRPTQFVQLIQNILYYNTKYKVRKTKFSVSLNQFSDIHIVSLVITLNLFMILLYHRACKVGNSATKLLRMRLNII